MPNGGDSEAYKQAGPTVTTTVYYAVLPLAVAYTCLISPLSSETEWGEKTQNGNGQQYFSDET